MNIISKYIAYLKDNPERYWFKRKLFGWGWTPATWQGWLVTGAYVALVLFFAFTIDPESSRKEVLLGFVLPLLILTFFFIRIAYRTGEKPKWSWGFPKKK